MSATCSMLVSILLLHGATVSGAHDIASSAERIVSISPSGEVSRLVETTKTHHYNLIRKHQAAELEVSGISGNWVKLAVSVRGEAGIPTIDPVELRRAGGKMMITWSSSVPGNVSVPDEYEKAVTFTVPEGERMLASRRVPKELDDFANNEGQKCNEQGYFQPVTVTCVKGRCAMPTKMYTGAHFNRICFGKAFGLVAPSGSPVCDWKLGNTQSSATLAAAIYIGSNSNGCHGVKDGEDGYLENAALGAIALWAPAPEDCEWADWTWTQPGHCTRTCGGGVQQRTGTRAPKKEAKYGGKDCAGSTSTVQTLECDTKPCPPDPTQTQ